VYYYIIIQAHRTRTKTMSCRSCEYRKVDGKQMPRKGLRPDTPPKGANNLAELRICHTIQPALAAEIGRYNIIL